MEFAFFGLRVKSVFVESSEDLLDMLFGRSHVLGEDKDVVQINYNANIEEICKDSVNKPLKSHRGVRKTERHD